MNKKALVLAGGGTRGAYQIGAWKALRELGERFDIITGTSIGALNGILILQDDYEFAMDLWNELRMDVFLTDAIDFDAQDLDKTQKELLYDFLTKSSFKGGADTSPMQTLIQDHVREDFIRNSDIDFGLVTMEYPSLNKVEITKSEIPYGQISDYLMASSACFPAFRPHIIGDKKYIDGGYFDNMPLNLAIKMGATNIVAIDLVPNANKKKIKKCVVPLTYICPKNSLGPAFLFSKNSAKANMQLGYLDTMKGYNKCEGTHYYIKIYSKYQHLRQLTRSYHFAKQKIIDIYNQNKKHPLYAIGKYKINQIIAKDKDNTHSADEIMLCAEIAANILNIKNNKIYTMKELSDEIAQKFATIPQISYSRVEKNMQMLLQGNPQAITDPMRKDWILSYLYHYLSDLFKGRKRRFALCIWANIYPNELLAALYLYTLFLNKRLTKLK